MQVISGLRIARSYITPINAVSSRELNFNLSTRQGIQIQSVLGIINPLVHSIGSSQGLHDCVQTLHLETGSLETVPNGAGADEDTVDSEIFFVQNFSRLANDDPTTEFRASAAQMVQPSGVIDYPDPILSSRNITHRAVGNVSVADYGCHIMVFYKFVEFTLSELGVILARRQ